MYLLKLDGNSTPFATVSDGKELNDRITLAIKEEISAEDGMCVTAYLYTSKYEYEQDVELLKEWE